MTEQSKKNRIQTTKSWFSERYKKPCFLLKAISYSVISLLVILGLFSLINFALANFTDAISYTYMAPERLGQLGDFLGGTLNPIFGFITIVILLTSLIFQKKSNKQQLQLFKSEQKIKQLEEIIEKTLFMTRNLFQADLPEQLKYLHRHGAIALTIDGEPNGYTTSHLKTLKDIYDLFKNKYLPGNTEKFKPAQAKIRELLGNENTKPQTPEHYNRKHLLTIKTTFELLIDAIEKLSEETKTDLTLRLYRIEIEEALELQKITGLICDTEHLKFTTRLADIAKHDEITK